jgi:hypothetical protein
VSDDAADGWLKVCRALWARELDVQEGRSCPHTVYFSDAGRTEFDVLYDQHVDEVNAADFPDSLRGSWSKLEAYAWRLSLILSLLWRAADPTADQRTLPSVEPVIARHAWRLVSYFKSHHRRVRASLQGRGLGGAPEGTHLILNWIRNHQDKGSFDERDLTRAYPLFGTDRAVLEDALAWLEERHAIRREEQEATRGKPGRKQSPTWSIHPDLTSAQSAESAK